MHFVLGLLDLALRLLLGFIRSLARRTLLLLLVRIADQVDYVGRPPRNRSLDGELPAVRQGNRVKRNDIFVKRREIAIAICQCAFHRRNASDVYDLARCDAPLRNYRLVESINRFNDLPVNQFPRVIHARPLIECDANRRSARECERNLRRRGRNGRRGNLVSFRRSGRRTLHHEGAADRDVRA